MHSNNNNNFKNMHQPGNEFSLFVGDLPPDCSDEKLQRLFQSKFKSVKRVQIIRNEDGSSRCFGFIKFEDRADFQAALSQEMKIGNNTLRLDMAHRPNKGRGRYSSFNSTGSNNSNHHNHHHHHFNNNNNLHHPHHHHHHHHNQPHQHHHHLQQQTQHGSQQSHHSNQSQTTTVPTNNNNSNNNNNVNNKTPVTDPTSLSGQQNQPSTNNQTLAASARSNNSQPSSVSGSATSIGHPPPPIHHQQHQNPHHNNQQNPYNSAHKKNNQHHQASDTKNTKQSNLSLGGDDAAHAQGQQQTSQHTQQQILPQPHVQHSLPPVGNSNIGVALPNSSITTTTSATTTMSNSSQNHTSNAVINNHHNLSANQQAIGPDLRGYMPTSMMDTSHLMGGDASMVQPTNIYGHVYPYGPPPPFGYMHPPPQPNPVIPISAVPPAPSNQASPSSGLSQQHTLTASSATRYSDAQHPHQPQQAHATGADGSTMPGTLPGGVQAPHQAPPFYYYYPSPLYFDHAGAAAPPNLYHPQSFHPQFFAVPNPAYMPNAHNYNQQQPQTASQSDANVMNPQQQPQHQPQVNLRTRDIDTTIE